ncbi:MAG TPA: adenylosuccinate lyase [Firmicutes bacterium]|nr:adenylosuccinate lyase [Bacillota bacterium]
MITRYARPQMRSLWSQESKFQTWLEVELLACEAWCQLGVIPAQAVQEIKDRAGFDLGRIAEIEAETRHDVIAFLTAVGERVGPAARYIHYGLTSSDVVDTALSVQMVRAVDILLKGLADLKAVLREQAIRHRATVMVGRTHGIHAEPVVLGLKFALWLSETERNLARLRVVRERVAVGKLSGAVGTYANLDPRVEEYVCRALGLQPAPVSTQILQRDRHAELLTTLAVIAGCLEKYATEVRLLQKTETREVEEPFRPGQKGSSAMPHKRNPVSSERIAGLARVVRGHALTALENISLWHERDISHSSAERIIIPDSTTLVDFMLTQVTDILRDLHIYPANMVRNLQATQGLIFSQRVLLVLVQKGLTREDAYRVVQDAAMQTWSGAGHLRDVLAKDERLMAVIDERELAACFDPNGFLQHVGTIYDRLGLSE